MFASFSSGNCQSPSGKRRSSVSASSCATRMLATSAQYSEMNAAREVDERKESQDGARASAPHRATEARAFRASDGSAAMAPRRELCKLYGLFLPKRSIRDVSNTLLGANLPSDRRPLMKSSMCVDSFRATTLTVWLRHRVTCAIKRRQSSSGVHVPKNA